MTDLARSKIKKVGESVCHICNRRRRDCVEVKRNWFSAFTICDGCGRELFLSFDRKKSGTVPDNVDVRG